MINISNSKELTLESSGIVIKNKAIRLCTEEGAVDFTIECKVDFNKIPEKYRMLALSSLSNF